MIASLAAIGAIAAGCSAASQADPCTLCSAGVAGLLGGDQCPSASSQPTATTAAARLQQLIEQVPCPSTGRVSFATTDDQGAPMGVLDVIGDPTGGYLGVYHTAFGPSDNGVTYRISLARSTDLIHWHRLAVLDADGSSMPTLGVIPGQPGFILAYEKTSSSKAPHVIRLRYYATRDQLVAGAFQAQRDLPLRFSPFNNGTPTILGIRWGGALRRSRIDLGFHYETAYRGRPGPDREAVGTLHGFGRWTARPANATDTLLSRQGLLGSHGDWRQFGFESGWWRLYEAQTRFNDFTSWHVLLAGQASRDIYPLTLKAGGAVLSSSLGNPVARVLPGPQGQGRVLVVTLFLFAANVPQQAGELVYYQPI
jgi:hypothetical protein